MKIINLIKSEALKYTAELRRYLFNTISSLLVIYIIFLVYFFGIKFMTGPALSTGKLDLLIIGYIMWMLAIIGFESTGYTVYDEMQRGTFEQMYMTSLGIETVFIIRIIFETIFSFVFSSIILILTMFTTGRYFVFPVFNVIIVLMLALPSMWGLGFIFAGLSLIFKKIASFLNLMQFIIITLVVVDAYPINFFSFLPFSAGAITVQKIINDHSSFSVLWYIFISLISIFYMILGILVFRLLLKKARKLNLLGQY